MNAQNLKELVSRKTVEAVKTAISNGKVVACAAIDTDKWCIDTCVTKKGYVEVLICHYDDIKRWSLNLEAFLEGALRSIKWSDIEAEVIAEETETPEQEYARRGESMFARGMQWHRI